VTCRHYAARKTFGLARAGHWVDLSETISNEF
jgi:hypothetical protein